MRTKGIVIIFLVIMGVLISGFDLFKIGKPVCSCGTVNDLVSGRLSTIEFLIHDYAMQHNGRFPTYGEFVGIVTDKLPNKQIIKELTSHVDIENRKFAFILQQNDAGKIGYAVFPNRQNYVLIGGGIIEKRNIVKLFGKEIYKWKTGYEYPILHGNTPTTTFY